ncbi:NAD(P)-dependent oxidoreductase [Pelagibacterium lentulum]|uniref:3-hydroxyisobutyrate dehydrogenase n=1 Tax=Pelagibacterium lentulum TaxID=2029865 RepID=A0A916RJ06_9HYPH|nr:NAD(P)-binding domain-containing protein [Pelagibacterium lentulum]GGA59080.1 3-hydroxyisobutyrate dehydrogenase [Pelagibacterium lentulum]
MKHVVAIIGTGRMGSALATALLNGGHQVRVWNRSPSKYADLVRLGAQPSATVAEAVADADVVIVNVSDYAASSQVLDVAEVRTALASKLLVQLTSGSPRQARDSAAWATEHGIRYLDGAIMGTPNYIGKPEGTILYAGPEKEFNDYHNIFLALGGNARHVGTDVGHASALDCALLGSIVVDVEGIPPDLFTTFFAAFKPVVDDAVIDVATRVRDGRLKGDEATLASLDAHYSAFKQLLELTRERGLDPTLPDAFDQLFRRAMHAGLAQADFAALSAFLRRPIEAHRVGELA